MARRQVDGTFAAWASLGLAVAASAVLLFLPTTSRVTTRSSGSPSPPVVTHQTLLEHEGSSVLVVLAVPVLVAALGVLVGAGPGRLLLRVLAAFLLGVFSVLAAASIGLLYAPAALAMALAAAATPARVRPDRAPVWQAFRAPR